MAETMAADPKCLEHEMKVLGYLAPHLQAIFERISIEQISTELCYTLVIMPIYEYRCLNCRRCSTLLILKPQQTAVSCKHCNGTKLERIMSRFAAPKSEEARLESLVNPSKFSDLDEHDPKSMARFMKKMGREMGEDLGDDFGEAMEGMEGDGEVDPSISDVGS